MNVFFENAHQGILATPYHLLFDQKWEMNQIKIRVSQD